MAEIAIEQARPHGGITARFKAAIAERAVRREERKAVFTWLRENPPSLGRETGARV